MSYILSGLKVVVPQRSQRPREPGRPQPSQVLTSPALATRMQRPRTPTDPGASKPHVDRLKALKLQQAACERQVAAMQKALSVCKDEKTCLGIKKNVATLIERIKSLSSLANKEAMAAVEKGASATVVKDVAADASASSSVTPVIEASTAELRPDGSVAVSADAQVTEVPVTSDPGSTTAVVAPVSDLSGDDKMSAPVMIGLGIGALFLLSRMRK